MSSNEKTATVVAYDAKVGIGELRDEATGQRVKVHAAALRLPLAYPDAPPRVGQRVRYEVESDGHGAETTAGRVWVIA